MLPNLEKITMNTKTLDNTVTDLIDELHNLTALVGAAKQAAYDFSCGEHDTALVDRIDRFSGSESTGFGNDGLDII